MLIDKVKKFSNMELGLNCSEIMLYSANEEYELNLEEKAFKLMAGLGGGMFVESVCGAVTGGVAVIGAVFTNNKCSDSEKVIELTQEFVNTFKERLGSYNCDYLRPKYSDEIKGCEKIVFVAAEILDNIVRREFNK